MNIADNIFLHGNEGNAYGFVGLRVCGGKIFRDAVHIGFCLRERYTRLQAANRVRAHVDAAVAKRWIVPLTDGSVGIPVVTIESETCWNHAHDRAGCAIQNDRLSEDPERRAKLAFPEASPKNHDRCGARVIIIEKEVTAENGPYAKRRKKVRRNHITAEALRFARADEVVVLVAVYGHRGKRLRVALPIEEIQVRNGGVIESRSLSINRNQLAGLRVRQRIEQNAVDHGK